MAPRTKTVRTSTHDDFDGSYDLESSPDPLAASVTEYTMPKRRISARPSQPLTSTSPSKQNKASNYAEIDPASPSKSLILSTPRAGGASPWRIKVTVQAEPGSDAENMESPTVKRVTRTKTTTVPLKDADASSPAKRRGRPRKSDAVSAKPKRSGTPVRRAAKSKTRASSIGVEGSTADVDTDAPPKKRRGRPRKSIQPPTKDDEKMIIAAEPERVPVVEDVPLARADTEECRSAHSTPSRTVETETTQSSSQKQQQIESSQNIRARKGTPARTSKILLEISSDEESDDDGADTPEDSDRGPQKPRDIQNIGSYTTMDFEASEGSSSDIEDEIQDVTSFAFEEGATRMPDDTIILESENFSMVSVDSLPSGGSLTSPVNVSATRTASVAATESLAKSDYLQIPPASMQQPDHEIGGTSISARGASPGDPSGVPIEPSLSFAPPRHKTPSIETRSPSQPPPIEPGRSSPTEAKTPKIGRVMKAGVALQGVLDPNRVTPEANHIKIVEEDIFRGFSERTRRELQAGLRLGEQLAQRPPSVRHSPALSSAIKDKDKDAASNASITGSQQHNSRLPTPEDQDETKLPSPPPTQTTDVQYPKLNDVSPSSQLLSPARSDDEMSWRVDTPPVCTVSTQEQEIPTVNTDAGRLIRNQEKYALANRYENNDDDKGVDIWEEEASRSSNLSTGNLGAEGTSPQLQDLFVQDGAVKPARSKLPRTWRRKSSSNFQYSDEADEVPEITPPSTGSEKTLDERVDGGKRKAAEPVTEEQDFGDDEEGNSETSDDTGMFFANNLPNTFNKRRSTELKRRKAEKLDLSLLMREGESMAPESSPPVNHVQTPSMAKINPFLDTPPRFAGFNSSPVKGSPLRQEYHASDTSSGSIRQEFEESTLPLPPSSPFHTQVDGETALTAASDQRQIQEEMAAGTDSSLRNIRNEADNYLDAYSLQERTLGEIEEVTEPSRTFVREPKEVSLVSPVKKAFEESMARPTRAHVPLFRAEAEHQKLVPMPAVSSTTAVKPKPAKPALEEKPLGSAAPSSGVFGRLTSTLWGVLGNSPPPPDHPILSKFNQLPKVEPWTKTHYKTLDALYQRHKKKPTLFKPSASVNTTNTNNAILEDFLRKHKRSFVGARYAVWGYSVTFDESLVVLCAVFMQLLVLKDISEYEAVTGKRIQMGDCGPGITGEVIAVEEAMKRLATVVMGEDLRRDEKRGLEIDRSGTLTVTWPA